jgi:very-short-patch-repair endonuclease
VPSPTLDQLAERQDGLITRTQALESGLTTAAIKYALRASGPWQRVLTGIYATFTGSLQDLHRLRAATLAAGPASVVTGPWACHLAGLQYGPPAGEDINVLIPASSDRGKVGFVRVTRTVRVPKPRYWIHDDDLGDRPLDTLTEGPGVIPIAPPARAVVDTVTLPHRLPADWNPACTTGGCPTCSNGPGHASIALRNVRALMCEVVQRRRTDVATLQSELAAAARRGGPLARSALTDILAGCRSAPECELRDLVLTRRDLPEPRWNRPLPGHRDIVPDACWPEARLVVEVDSRSFHGFSDAPERTERRRARYASLGWRVLPVSPARLRSDPNAVLEEIVAAYRAGRSGLV